MNAILLLLVLLAQPGDTLEGLAAEGRWDELRALADDRLASDPTDARAHYWLGRDQFAQALQLLDGGRVGRDLGRTLLDRAVEHLARVVPAAGSATADARDWWLEARFARRLPLAEGDGRNPAEADLESDLEALWLDERLPLAAFLRGLLAEEAGDAAALEWYQRAADTAPERSRYQQQLALALAGVGRRDDSLAAFERAATAPDAWLGDLLPVLMSMLPGRRDAATRLQHLDPLLEVPGWGGDALLAWHRAHALRQLGREGDALAAFERVTEGRTAEIDRAHASHLIAAGRAQDALALLLPRVREHDWSSLDQALVAVGQLALDRRHDEAIAACDALLEVEPRHDLVLWNRALLLWKAGRDGEAEAAFDALIERLPGRADVLNDAALGAWGAGRLERARRLLEQAVALPGAIDAEENLALLLLDAGDDARPRAESLLARVLEAEPGRPRALWLRHRWRNRH